MPTEVKLYRVFIASPSDVAEERKIVRDEIANWNSTHSEFMKIVLLPVGSETNATPDLSDRGQAIINRQLVDNCDFLIGIFGIRMGTPTPEARSGTEEEIERAHSEGKRCIVYFSNKAICASDDKQQYEELQKYIKEIHGGGLTSSYKDTSDFAEQIRRHISTVINERTIEDRDKKAAEQIATLTEKAIRVDTQAALQNSSQHINLTTLTEARQTIRYLAEYKFGTQELEDIKDGEIAEIQNKLNSPELSILLSQPPTIKNIPATVQVIEEISNSSMLAISSIGRYGDDNLSDWVEIAGDWVEELSNRDSGVGFVWANCIKNYTGLIAFYSMGISALRSGRIGFLKNIAERKFYSREYRKEVLLLDVLHPEGIFYDEIHKLIEPGFDRNYTPASDHLSALIKRKLHPSLTEETHSCLFDLFEFIITLKSVQMGVKYPYFGSYSWRTETRPFIIQAIQNAALGKGRTGMGVLKFFDNIETIETTAQKYGELVKETRLGVGRYGPFPNISELIQAAKNKI
jgi:hypothetical protein